MNMNDFTHENVYLVSYNFARGIGLSSEQILPSLPSIYLFLFLSNLKVFIYSPSFPNK